MKKLLIPFMAALSLFAVAGCKSNKVEKKPVAVPGIIRYCGEWKVTSMTGFDNVYDAYMNITYVDDVENGTELSVNGFSGVNHFFASIKDEDSIPLGNNMGSTKMMGAPEEMAFEDTFLFVLATAEEWNVEMRELTVTNGKETITFHNDYVSDK